MRVHVERVPWRDEVRVYVGDGEIHRVYDPDEPGRCVRVEAGVEAAPFLVLPAYEFDAIVEAAIMSRPTPEAAFDAVKDARATRDRLLALVEKAWPRS